MIYKYRILLFLTMLACVIPRTCLAESNWPPKQVLLISLLQKASRQELQFTPEQTKSFVKLYHEYKQKWGEAYESYATRAAKGEERTKVWDELLVPIDKACDEAVLSLLKPEQVKRLKQMKLQQQGYRAFAEPTVIQALNLTDKQNKLFESITKDLDEELPNYERIMEESNRKHPLNLSPAEEMGRALTAKFVLLGTANRWAIKMMVSHLTDEQKKIWEELHGKPFVYDPSLPDPDLNNP